MITSTKKPRRSLTWPIIIMCLCIAALATAALLVENDRADTILGAFAGALSVTVLACIALAVFRTRAKSKWRDAARLDDLEPLRGAGKTGDGKQP